MGRSMTRRSALGAVGATAAAAALGGGLLGSDAARSSPSSGQDARVLAFLLAVERIEAGFYGRAAELGALPGELGRAASTIAAQQREHLAILSEALGSDVPAPARPRADVDALLRDPRHFARTAAELEDVVVGAYNGQATNLTPARLATVAGIVSVEARHAAWIRDASGLPQPADATDDPLAVADVRAALRSQGLLP
jgi:hypothetical protein